MVRDRVLILLPQCEWVLMSETAHFLRYVVSSSFCVCVECLHLTLVWTCHLLPFVSAYSALCTVSDAALNLE